MHSFIFSHVIFNITRIFNRFPWMFSSFAERVYTFHHQQVRKELAPIAVKTIAPSRAIKPPKNPSMEVIWVFWADGFANCPEVVRSCVDALKKMSSWSVVELDLKNLEHFVHLPDFIWKKLNSGQITVTQFSDILRMALLANKGGFWMDATILVTKDPVPYILENSFFTVKTPNCTRFNVSHGRWTGFCIGGAKFRPIANYAYAFFIEYWKINDKLIDYFLIDYILDEAYTRDISGFRALIDNTKISNPAIYRLAQLLQDKETSKLDLQACSEHTNIFKLTYKKQLDFKKLAVFVNVSEGVS